MSFLFQVPFGIVEEATFTNIGDVHLGQISGLAFDRDNQLFVFHRGSRVWDGRFALFEIVNIFRNNCQAIDDRKCLLIY